MLKNYLTIILRKLRKERLYTFAVATPIVVYTMQAWLASFKYHVALKPGVFITAVQGFVTLNIVITLVYTLSVLRANPAHTLRNE